MSKSERGAHLQISKLEVLLPNFDHADCFVMTGYDLLVGEDFAMVKDIFMCL
jgi:hypothetical protein